MSTEGFADDGTMLKDLAQFDLAREMKQSEAEKAMAEWAILRRRSLRNQISEWCSS